MLLGLGGYQSSFKKSQAADGKVIIHMKSAKQQMNDKYTLNDYKKIFSTVIKEVKGYRTKNKLLKKWIIRTLVEEKLYYQTKLSKEQIIQLAQQEMKDNEAWKVYAKKKYGITVTDKEIDNYINKGPDKSSIPEQTAFADALDMSLKEFNHQFYRDIYERDVIWLKLKPKLENKYKMTNNNALLKKYKGEYSKNLKQKFTFK